MSKYLSCKIESIKNKKNNKQLSELKKITCKSDQRRQHLREEKEANKKV